MTISQAFEAYARDVIAFRNQSFKTEEASNVACKSLCLYVGDIDIESLTFNNIRDWKLSLEKRRLSPITIRGYLIKLRVVLAYLTKQGYEVLSPESVPLPKRVEKVPNFLSADQITELIDSTSSLKAKAIISLLYASGIRVSELCGLNRADLKPNRSFTVVGKGSKARICFYDLRTAEYLKAYLRSRHDGQEALFVSRLSNFRINPHHVEEIFKHIRKKRGYKDTVSAHWMRHSYATNLMMNGIDLYQLMKLMGHSSLQTTQLYLKISDKHLEEDYQKYHSV